MKNRSAKWWIKTNDKMCIHLKVLKQEYYDWFNKWGRTDRLKEIVIKSQKKIKKRRKYLIGEYLNKDIPTNLSAEEEQVC